MEKTTNAKDFRAMAEKKLRADHGAAFSSAIFAKAMAKARRHMIAKYGCADYAEELSESGISNVVEYYHETIAVPGGGNTFNRRRAGNARLTTVGGAACGSCPTPPVVPVVPQALAAAVASLSAAMKSGDAAAVAKCRATVREMTR